MLLATLAMTLPLPPPFVQIYIEIQLPQVLMKRSNSPKDIPLVTQWRLVILQ